MSGRNDSPDRVRLGGRLLGVGVSGTCLTAPERETLAVVAPAAVVLFARNVKSPDQLVELIGSIRDIANPAPIFMIDEEGGRVDRLRALVPGIPSAADMATCPDVALSEEFGQVIGRLLAEFDIEVNLAPVVDVWRDGLSPSLVRRCFGSDPISVADRAAAFVRGMARHGVLSCLKHFPGLGVAETDPHHATSLVELTIDELESIDLLPYRLLSSAAPAVMVGHGIYPRVDESLLPGTLSHFVSTTLLRERIGFAGLTISDDMEMHAVSDLAGGAEIAARSVAAGNDLVLFCSRIGEAREIAAGIAGLAASTDGEARLSEARGRVDSFVRQCGALSALRAESRRGLEPVREAVARLGGKLDAM